MSNVGISLGHGEGRTLAVHNLGLRGVMKDLGVQGLGVVQDVGFAA